MDPMTMSLLAAGLSAAGSIGGAAFAKNPKETAMQKQKRMLLDDLISSLKGGGSFGDLFAMDEGAFQKSFVDPAKARFSNQIAPQIQQSFIASGQQRGTGVEDTLSRAGVDLDQLLNEQYMGFQNQAQDRKFSMLNSILGAGDGAAAPLSTGDKFQQGAAGYLTSNQFGNSIEDILKAFSSQSAGAKAPQPQQRAGYSL